MHWLSIPLGILTIWRCSREAPPGTVLATGILLSAVGLGLSFLRNSIAKLIALDIMVVGLICLPIGAFELGHFFLAERRRRAEVGNDFSMSELKARIAELARNQKPGEEITFELVRESKPNREARGDLH